MRNNKRLKAVLFDLDDTLIDWSGRSMAWPEFIAPKIANVHRYLTGEGHRPPPAELLGDLIHEKTRFVWERAKESWAGATLAEALRLAFEEAGLPAGEINYQAVMRAYEWEPIPGVVPFDDTHDVLDAIREQGYKIGLITNAYQPMWFRDVELEAYRLLDYFDARITSGDTGFIKPHPAIYWRMLGLLDLMPHEAIFVGDRPGNDILGAHNVNMLSVLMTHPNLEPYGREDEGIEAHYNIKTLTELLPILAQLD